jgi:hypothetical protein
MKGLFEDCRSHTCWFTTPHLSVVKQSRRKGAAQTTRINRYLYCAKPIIVTDGGFIGWPCQIELDASREIIQRMSAGGPTPVRSIRAVDMPDWSAGEMVYELLFGIRERLGPVSFDLIDESAGFKSDYWINGQRRIGFDAAGCWINGRRVNIDEVVSAKVRERLSLSTIDDTWNMLLGYDATPADRSPLRSSRCRYFTTRRSQQN